MAYWDTSAIIKLYAAEEDSPFFLQLVANMDEPILSSTIMPTELLCALYRKEYGGALKRGGAKGIFRKFSADVGAGRILTIPYGPDVEAEAENLVRLAFAQPRPVMIRSLDVIHISTALSSKTNLIIATDARLREVAALVRLDVLP